MDIYVREEAKHDDARNSQTYAKISRMPTVTRFNKKAKRKGEFDLAITVPTGQRYRSSEGREGGEGGIGLEVGYA